MKTNFKLGLVGFFLAGTFFSKAQTLTVTGPVTPSTLPFLGGGTSLRVGVNAGNSMTNATTDCTFVGFNAGRVTTNGNRNSFLGKSSGENNTTGSSNVFAGNFAGFSNTTGGLNTFLGENSGYSNLIGVNNTYIGRGAGYQCNGSRNVFLGFQAGYFESKNDMLYIDNSNTANPLIWGDFLADQLKFHGKVGIGGNSTTAFGVFPTAAGGVNVSTYNLFVTGGILTEALRINLRSGNAWADYVFNKDYKLPTLNEVEKQIKEKGHLADIPSAKEVAENGIELAEMNKLLLQKIEELTLYMIEQNKTNEKQAKQIEELITLVNAKK